MLLYDIYFVHCDHQQEDNLSGMMKNVAFWTLVEGHNPWVSTVYFKSKKKIQIDGLNGCGYFIVLTLCLLSESGKNCLIVRESENKTMSDYPSIRKLESPKTNNIKLI